MAFLYGLDRIRLGISISDEGMYLAAPMRYALGDIPFRDEFLNPHRMFDLVLWPLFEFFPEITVYQLRLTWLIVQTGSAMALYSVFKRYAPSWIPALACAATVYFCNLIWSPGYHLMGSYLFVLSWSLWLAACLSPRRSIQIGLGGASGLVFFVGGLSYLPLLAVQIVPACVLGAEIYRGPRWTGKTVATVVHMVLLLILVVTTLLIFAYYGLLTDWMSAHTTSLASKQYATTLAEKVFGLLGEIAPHLIVLLSVSALVAVLLLCCRDWKPLARATNSRSGIALLSFAPATLILIFALEVVPMPPELTRIGELFALPLRIFMIVLGLHVGALLFLLLCGWGRADQTWWFVYLSTLGGSFVLAILHGLLSGMAFKAMFALLPLFVSGVVIVYRAMLSGATSPRAEFRAALVAGAIGLSLGVGCYSWLSVLSYGDAPRSEMTAEFSTPRLVGISSHPDRVNSLDEVSSYLSASMEDGDFLLVAGHAPLLYYLTRTRPALDHTWTAPEISPQVRRRSISWMSAQGRVPQFAVRYRLLAPPRARVSTQRGKRNHPVHAFILKHYRLEQRFGFFEVWKLR